MPHFENSRSIGIDAAPAVVHTHIDDFRNWTAWSPWEELDPAVKRSYTGAEAGVGAHYAWEGNNKVGQGSMEITASTPERIDIDLEFLKPFKASNKTVFTLTPQGTGTRVDWTMSGERNLAFAILGKLFFDKAIAKDFDKGLTKLKAAAES
ncbi:SRPBCC family protein [Nocardioides jiangxiensis]|uniref:SRPBCC family protein n=1 Tax=Nocardioides jiangxiensis TaxID=3064524 RepID=A0ABT9B548_9ACTN|nr:SRPBCC family protein [Nocardioides sp. WY-20]MDO7868426.1 SRPBCC family protein [Nocardioides sp. WY-20]